MCGICGYFGEANKSVLKKMNNLIVHRGPDDTGLFVDSGVGLAQQRLSIIDIKTGHQPMSNEDGTVWITFNGEIYNYKDVKQKLGRHKFSTNSDTEVIIHAYEEWGLDFVKKIHGMFAIALWDSKKKQLILARDRLGKKPLYYTTINNTLYFSSELKSFTVLDGFDRTIDDQAVHDFLTYRYVPEPKTMFKSVKKIPRATVNVFGFRKSKIEHLISKQFWDFSFSEPKQGKFDEEKAVDELDALMKSAVEKRLMSEVPYGVYLSGGLDSSLILGIMNSLDKTTVKTFSVGYDMPGFKDEISSAKKVAEHFNTEHTETIIDYNPIKLIPKIVWHLDEPIADPTTIPIYLLSKETKKKVTVIMSGEGADETFGGYEQYKIMNLLTKAKPLFSSGLIRRAAGAGIRLAPNILLDRLFKYSSGLGKEGKERAIDFLTNFKGSEEDYLKIISIFNEEEKQKLYNEAQANKSKSFVESKTVLAPYFGGKNRQLHIINKSILADNNTFLQQLLLKTDKMTMAHAIETRLPFLDTDVVEFAAKLPVSEKVHGLNEKYILKQLGKRYVPDFVVKRKKQRFFVPVHRWVQEDIDAFSGIVTRKSALERNYFDKKELLRIKEKYNSSPLYYGRQMWNLVILEHWFKLFVDGQKA